MKVCFFIATLNDSGGTQRVTLFIGEELVKRGYEVSVITWYGGINSFFKIPEKIDVHCLFNAPKINLYKNYAASVTRYKSIIKKLNPAAVIDVCVPLSIITAAALMFNRTIKKIAWEHFNAAVSWNFFTGKFSRRIVSSFYNNVVVLTAADKKMYEEKFRAKNVVVIPNPVTINVTQKSACTAPIVLAIGRLTHQKGFDMLLKAWAIICTRHKEWKLRLIGGGEDAEMLTVLAGELNINNSIELIAPTNAIAKYYLDASLYVMSSRFEGLPLVLIEAKAFGLPLISFNCETGPRDVINHNHDGLLVEPNNIEALAAAMEQMITTPGMIKTFSKNSTELLNKFSTETIINQWLQILTAKPAQGK